MAVFGHRMLQFILDPAVLLDGKQPPGELLGEPFFLIVRIADGHAQHGFAETLVLFLGMCHEEVGHPLLESHRSQAGDVRACVQPLLDEMVGALELAEHSGYGRLLIVEDD